MIREALFVALKMALCTLLITPVICGMGFALIERYWRCRLDFEARVALAKVAAFQKMNGENSEEPDENE